MRPIKKQVAEVEDTYMENAVRKHLRIAQFNICNEADVEDIVSDAWLEQHSEEAILKCLLKAGLKRTPENIERAHQMITEELKDSKVSALGARQAAERWKENKKQLKEISLEKPVRVNPEDGSELLLREVLQPAHEDSRDYLPSKAAQKFKAEQVLTPEELKWLADYDAAREPKGKRGAKRSKKPHSAAERQRAQRLRKKAKQRLEKIL